MKYPQYELEDLFTQSRRPVSTNWSFLLPIARIIIIKIILHLILRF